MECFKKTIIFPCMEATDFYQENFDIRSFHIDYWGRLRPGALLQFFTECAGMHAHRIGAGYRQLQPLGMLWVLSRIRIVLNRIPQWGERIVVTTWPKGFYKLFAQRDFLVTDSGEQVIARATSCWLLIDRPTRRPLRYDRLPVVIPYNALHHALTERPEKLSVTGQLLAEHCRTPKFSELDVNHHLNSARYCEWILDEFDPEWHRNHTLRVLQINFMNEINPDEPICIKRYYYSENNQNRVETFYVEGYKSSGSHAFQSLIEFV